MTKIKTIALMLVSIFAAHFSAYATDHSLSVEVNYCEYRSNPEGIDVLRPRLSWVLASDLRGDGQSAFQVIVASSQALLNKNKGDIWNSGKIISEETKTIYDGSRLISRQHCFWKVRVWNSKGQVSPWGSIAKWSMGLLNRSDWKGEWITDPQLADTKNFPLVPVNCYRSQTTTHQDQAKWIILDLGHEQEVNSINIIPARPPNYNMDFKSVMYPLRFKVETARYKDFRDGKIVIDRTRQDELNPRQNDNIIKFKTVKARYIKLQVTKLSKWDVNLYGLALGGLKVYHNKKIISQNASVSCSDAIESDEWSSKFLLGTDNLVKIAPDANAIAVHSPDLADVAPENKVSRVPTLRKAFNIGESIKKATLFVSARGFYEFKINGSKVSNRFLSPGVSDFNKRISYQSYDVTELIHTGQNAMGALLGYGWYAGHLNLFGNRNIYGHYPLLLAQLEIELKDGRRITIATDKSWKSTLEGAILWSDLLDGEAVDLRKKNYGWSEPNYNDKNWSNVYVQPLDSTKLVWQRSQPIQAIRELNPVAVKKISKGVYVFDFGQEIAGWCRLRVQGKAGTHIRIRHAELLKKNGDIDMSNLWGTTQQEDYILDGEGETELSPHFTYHGFRYAQVSGLESLPEAGTITAVSLHDNIPETGEFSSSNALYNKLMETSKWTQRNLLFDVPTGCAARSERVGWTGDLRPCVQSLIYNMDVAAFLEKYAMDMRDEQTVDGRFTDIAPKAHLQNTDICVGSPGWADAGISMPWQAYVNYGDKQILKDHYAAAKRWVEYISSNNPNFIWAHKRGQDWGDWLSAGPETPRIIGSTAFFAHDAEQLSLMAGVLGNRTDEQKYRKLFNNIRQAFTARFVNEDGIISDSIGKADVQGSYALALSFNLLDDPLRSKAVDRLATLIKKNNNHLTTGFWSSIEMLLALSDNNRHQVASAVVNCKSQPSWGYMVKAGNGTFWESFDANTKNMSLNHWTYSSIGEWLWRYVAGLNVDEKSPGYKHFIVRPRPGKDVDSCNAEYISVRGPIRINWQQSAQNFQLNVKIPPGATATLYIPSTGVKNIMESGVPANQATGVKFIRQQNNETVIEAQSGTYHFDAKL